ncbi:flagellar filament capping protein FliD [Glaciihabitans sp. UYNi722]|uniref:flagellar filament capping protein FliD n=1 Tax=Glaciihabitans sp. UYNi722 TaxID=3156344 RepID=UPI00339576C5
MGISLDGLSSGLDTTTLIASLMQAEAQPQTLLKNQISNVNNEIAAYQALNAKISALADLAKSSAKPGALDLYKATTSSTTLTATTGAGATGGELQVVVSALATSQIGVSAAMATWPSPGTLTIVGHAGTAVEITPASDSLDDVVKAVNASAAGVTATKVAAGTDPVSGEKQYRIQFSSKTTGADSSFEVHTGAAVDVSAANNVLTASGAAVIKTAQDASITLWGGTSAEQVITSASNTFTDLLPGVNVTVTAVSTDPVTITVARDAAQVSTLTSSLVDSLKSVFSLISTNSTVSSSVGSDGQTAVKSGIFAGDSTVRDINQKILTAASMPINGHSPSEYGITVTRDGTLTFDKDKFTAALAADPATVNAVVTEIASRVAAAATNASDKYTGTLTGKITGDQSQARSLGDQVASWDIRLASRKAGLERTYSAMEVMLSNLKAQQASLTSQLSSLGSSTTGN